MPCVVARHKKRFVGCFPPGTGGVVCVEGSGGYGHTTRETVVLRMSRRRTGSVLNRDRCDCEEK